MFKFVLHTEREFFSYRWNRPNRKNQTTSSQHIKSFLHSIRNNVVGSGGWLGWAHRSPGSALRSSEGRTRSKRRRNR